MNFQLIGNIFLFITTAVIVELIFFYHRKSRGAWRDSPVGRHVMSFMAVEAVVLLLACVRVIIVDVLHLSDVVWFQALRALTFLAVPGVFLWRREIIRRSHNRNQSVTWKDSDGDTGYRGIPGQDFQAVPEVERQQRRRGHRHPRESHGEEGEDGDPPPDRRPRMGNGGQRRR